MPRQPIQEHQQPMHSMFQPLLNLHKRHNLYILPKIKLSAILPHRNNLRTRLPRGVIQVSYCLHLRQMPNLMPHMCKINIMHKVSYQLLFTVTPNPTFGKHPDRHMRSRMSPWLLQLQPTLHLEINRILCLLLIKLSLMLRPQPRPMSFMLR